MMPVEFRTLDDTLFIVRRTDQHEGLLTPMEAETAARTTITAANGQVRDLDAKEAELQNELCDAVLEGNDTQALRHQIGVIRSERETVRSAIAAQEAIIQAIHATVRDREAERIRQVHAARIDSLIAPFVQILREQNACPQSK